MITSAFSSVAPYLLTATALFSTNQFAAAQTPSPTSAPTYCSLKEFSDLHFTLNGDAVFTDGCRLHLTSEEPMKSGSAFSPYKFNDTGNYPFEAYFEYDITDTVVNGTSVGGSADGIAFMVHVDPMGVNALNDNGGALGVYGAGGIHCAIVVELDTYFGPTNEGPEAPFSSVNYTRAIDIVATNEDGDATRYAEVDVSDSFTMQGKVWVSHDSGRLSVYLAPQTATTRPPVPTVSVDIPVPDLLLNREEIYVGFSSSTGGEYDKHEVVFLSFDETTPTTSPPTSPPATSKPSPAPSPRPSASPTSTVITTTRERCDGKGKGKGKGKGGKGRGKARGKSGKGKGGSKRQLRGDMIA